MRVFFDENIPRRLRDALDGHEVSTVEQEGWKGKRNGELLALVEARFDVILTADGSIAHQNGLQGRNLSMIVVPTNRLAILLANADAVRVTIDEMERREGAVLVTIDWRGRRIMKRLDAVDEEGIELPAVESFAPR